MLHVHRADRADRLADALAWLLADPLEDPFAAEVVAVPTRGMERWLTQRMSAVLGARTGHADGICAGVVFPSPHQLVTDAVAAASGVDPDQDPWLPERSAWRLLETVEECIHEPWLTTLASYLGRDSDPPDPVKAVRRLSAVRHLAVLFDRYALHRPQMLEAWAAGNDIDATGQSLPAGAAWQAELWRRLRARIGTPGPAERRQRACTRLVEDPTLAELPDRIALFGLTRLPAGHLQVLQALGDAREVHLFLLHPSAHLWDTVARDLATETPSLRRADDRTAELPHNQLLASWGRDARELQVVLGALDENPADTEGQPSDPVPATLLGRIQDDIRQNRPAPGSPLPDQPDSRLVLDPDDTSIQIHSCHGRARQVEVIRDAVLHALAQDETLEPRDVIVMCPDIETFAPLIQATFGAGELMEDELSQPLPDELKPIDLRVRLADRSLRQTNPILGVISQLLDLSEQRMTATQVLDLADRGPVRRRFRFDDDDLTRLQDWIHQAGIRWGLDAERRRRFKLDRIEEGTWQAGIERLLLGVTMTDDGLRLFDDVLPLDDVESGAIDLAGRFTEFIARLGAATDQLAQGKPLAAWAEAIADAADALTATSPRDRWQRSELQRILDEIVLEAGASSAETEDLAPAEIRAHLFDRLQGRPTRANFRTGHLTVCTLMPMRSVPHRVVCLLGLDDGAFPRKAPRDGDDLMLDDPHIGERDPRSEDRQLLLDALMAATERVIVTYTGNDERTNTPRPPAVPVGELLDAVEATARCHSAAAREQVLIRHPLQPFDPRNFEVGTLIRERVWSFDPVTLDGARALNGPRQAPPPFLSRPLPPREDRVIELDDLVRFAEHPVRAFLRQRLGISLWGGSDEIQDGLPVELDGLERWRVGQRLLEARLGGVDGNTAIRAEIARGTLPPGVLGKPVIDSVYPTVDAIVAQSTAAVTAAPDPDPVDVRVALADGRILTGTIAGVRDDVLLTTTYSRVSPRQRLAAWVRLVAMTASAPERAFSAVTVGRAGGKDDVRTSSVGPLAETPEDRRLTAEAELAVLVDLYDRGMRAPLPIFTATSAAYADAARSGQDPVPPAEKEWRTEWLFDREDRDLEHQLALGGVRQFSELLTEPPEPDERGEGWDESEPSRFGRLARRLWDRLLDNEEVRAR